MKRIMILLAAAVLVSAVGAVAARADTDPGAAVTADLQKVVADATALHAAVQADAAKIAADAQALQGSTDAKAARAALQADWQQVVTDRQKLVPPVLADLKQLAADLQAVHAAKAGSPDLRAALRTANQTLAQERRDAAQALAAAHQATQALRQSIRKK